MLSIVALQQQAPTPQNPFKKGADIAKAPEQETSLHQGMPECNNFHFPEGRLPRAIHMHTCIHTYIHLHTYIHTYTHPYIRTSMHPHIHPNMHTYTKKIHTPMHKEHSFISPSIHTSMHTYMLKQTPIFIIYTYIYIWLLI